MHIQKSRGIVFADNHITGSRMGAFFLAEFCQDATVTGNTVDGTNGSRVMSVEKSCEDVTIVGNTFRKRGTRLLDQPAAQLCAGRQYLRQQHDQSASPIRGGAVAPSSRVTTNGTPSCISLPTNPAVVTAT